MKISKPKENKCDPGLGHWPGHLNDKWKSWSFPARFPQWRTLDTLSICENIYLNKIYLCHQETASLASCSGITLATWKYATEALLKASQVFKNAPCGCPKEQALFIESLITWFNYFSSLFWSWNRTLHLSPWDWYHGCSSLRPGHKMKLFLRKWHRWKWNFMRWTKKHVFSVNLIGLFLKKETICVKFVPSFLYQFANAL